MERVTSFLTGTQLGSDGSIVLKLYEGNSGSAQPALPNTGLVSILKISKVAWTALLTSIGTGSLGAVQAGTANTETLVNPLVVIDPGVASPIALA